MKNGRHDFKDFMHFINAMTRWTIKGFAFVDNKTLHRRKVACQKCPFTKKHKANIVSRLLFWWWNIDTTICIPCSCYVDLKQPLPTEQCGNVTHGTGKDFWSEDFDPDSGYIEDVESDRQEQDQRTLPPSAGDTGSS